MTEPRYTVEFNGTAGGWYVHDAQKTHESFGQTFANQPIYADEICEQLNAKDAESAALRARVSELEAALRAVADGVESGMGEWWPVMPPHLPADMEVLHDIGEIILEAIGTSTAPSPKPALVPATPQPSAYAQRQIERTATEKADERSGKK